MPEENKNKLTAPQVAAGMSPACQRAMAATGKALKAFSFYPESHPLREKLLDAAYQAVADLTKDVPIALIVHRNGFSFAEKETVFDNTPMTRAFAQELFIRQLQRLILLPGIARNDFTRFLSLLSLTPQKIIEDGGVAARLVADGIATIVVNEIDISAVFTRKYAGEAGDDVGAPDSSEADDFSADESQGSAGEQRKELTAEQLVEAMSAESDPERYRQLARLLLAKGRVLQQEAKFDRLFEVLSAMAEQSGDLTRSADCRDAAQTVLQQLTAGEMTEHLLDHLEDENFGQEERIYKILSRVGADVVDPLIARLLAATSKLSRKNLLTAVVRIGSAAQPSLITLLTDGNWQVVNTAVAILGEIGNRDAVKELALTTAHSDGRVRMESIRSLARIGGLEATSVLLDLLDDENQGIAIQAITWLGNSRNQAALKPLLQLVKKWDLLGKQQALKKEALLAIGRIGDRRALEPLFKMVSRRHWIMPGRWDELKVNAVEAIGNLGGESARAFLQSLPSDGGRISRACHTALEMMAQRNTVHE